MAINKQWLLVLLVFWATVVKAADGDNVHLRGVVVPGEQIKMSLPQNGVVTWIAAGGTIVNQGEKLAQIGDTKLVAERDQAQAMLAAAKTELAAAQHGLEKSRRLVQEDILSDIALTESEFAVKTAQANVVVMESKLKLAQLSVEQSALLLIRVKNWRKLAIPN